MTQQDAAKAQVTAEVDRLADVLLDASHQIHAEPELAFEEKAAHDLLTGLLEGEGLEVERGAYGLPTGFAARAGSGDGPTVAVLLEYDALPEIGHACGHNVIAAAGLGAGLAAASVAEQLGGKVLILGTPAEEGGGGKIFMADAGALDGVDAAMMIHPADADLTRITAIAVQQLKVRYQGRAAHAAAAPQQGVNALDAAVLGYNAVAALRQHIRPDERVHGIFTDGGGPRPNIVPEHAATYWYVRSPRLDTLARLKPRVLAALQAGADATGCTMEHEWIDPAYADMADSVPLLDAFSENSAALGRPLTEPSAATAVVGSTDMGNVSYAVPAIHPVLQAAPGGTAIHTADFAGHAAASQADQTVLHGAKAMAMTVVDLWTRPELLEAARADHVAVRERAAATS
jgi:amidohydrolase